jgi:hypothetical protein
MKLHTKSRDGVLYEAMATYEAGIITVEKGSKINRKNAEGFKPKKNVATLREDDSLFNEGCILNKDLAFNSLSTAATFVTGRTANGMIVWKTEDGKYVRYTLQKKEA